MIDLYAWPTPNAHKVSIMLEECGLAYNVIPVDITKGDQFAPAFLKISPNNRMPVIVDPEGPDGGPISVFESGAILIYLADKTGRFLPARGNARYNVLEWLMFQMANLGPVCGQAHHFRQYAADKAPYAVDRFTSEAGRLYNVMERRLGEVEFLAGAYSIADMACWPWVRLHRHHGQPFEDYPEVKRWFDSISARPATQRGMALLAEKRGGEVDAAARDVLFGRTQYEKR